MRDSDESVSSGVLVSPFAASRCGARTGAFGLKSEFFRPLPNLLPGLGALALSSLLVCVAIKHLPKKEKADLTSACLSPVCPLLIIGHRSFGHPNFPIVSRETRS